MTRSFQLAPMSPLIRGLTVLLWAVPGVLFAISFRSGEPEPASVASALVVLYALVWLFWRPLRFDLSADGLAIVFPARRKLVPKQAIEAVEAVSADELKRRHGRLLRVGVGGMWGGFGWLWGGGGASLEFYVSRNDGLVLVRRRGALPLLITPERAEEFVAALAVWPGGSGAVS